MSNQLNAYEVASLEAAGVQVNANSPVRAYTPSTGDIPNDALPPGGDPEYVARMLAVAGNPTERAKVVNGSDYTGRLPAVVGALEGWSKSGSVRAPSDLRPGDTISYMGTRIEVSQALREGIIERDVTGGYRSLSSPDRTAIQAQDRRAVTDQAAADATELVALRQAGEELPQAAQAVVDSVVARADGQAVENVLRELVSTGDVSASTLAQAGMSAGYSSTQAANAYNAMYAGYREQADTCAAILGVPREQTDALWNWAAENHTEVHRIAINSLIRGGGTDGIKALAKGYVAHLRAIA
jgi:hypothetical protein